MWRVCSRTGLSMAAPLTLWADLSVWGRGALSHASLHSWPLSFTFYTPVAPPSSCDNQKCLWILQNCPLPVENHGCPGEPTRLVDGLKRSGQVWDGEASSGWRTGFDHPTLGYKLYYSPDEQMQAQPSRTPDFKKEAGKASNQIFPQRSIKWQHDKYNKEGM